jgi:hypothetical protein
MNFSATEQWRGTGYSSLVVTAKVLHDANCPIWTGIHNDEMPQVSGDFRHIVRAVDLGPQSPKALAWAWNFAREFNAELTLPHVLAHPQPPSDFSARERP